MKFFIIFTVFSISWSSCESSKPKFHEILTKEELQDIFHVESVHDVPEYSITSIHSRVRRSTEGSHVRTVHLNAFGEKKTLNLTPNEFLSKKVPVFYADAHNESSSVVFTPAVHTEDIGVPYQDESSMAAVLISHHPDSGSLLVDGTFGDDFVVRSMPHSLAESAKRGKEEELSDNQLYEDAAFLDDGENIEDDLIFSDGLPLVADGEDFPSKTVVSHLGSEKNSSKRQLPADLLLLRKKRSATTEGLHVVYKRKSAPIDTDFAYMEVDKIPTGKPRSKREKRDAPYVIYPEILVLVDYDGYLLHGQDNSKIKSYYVSFWNGADLRYKLLKSPKVKVSIAGIIISRSRDAMPYLERNRVGRDAIDSASALTDMGKYLYEERRLPTYDVAVAITKYDLCRRRQSGECTTGTAGFAYVGGACVVNKRLQKVNSVAIVEDTGGFSGIIVAAHEVGHLLGAVHDGSPPPSYLGGPGARRCRWKDGYIMSDLRHTEKGFRWSPCSVEQFHHFLNGETATCLYNLPHEDESLPRILPGKLMSLDAQCRKDRGTSACFKDDRVCAQLFCFDKSSGYCVSYRPAAEGSDCGDGKVCMNGKCVYNDDNSISDFEVHRTIDNKLLDTTQSSVDQVRDSPVTENWKFDQPQTAVPQTTETPKPILTTTRYQQPKNNESNRNLTNKKTVSFWQKNEVNTVQNDQTLDIATTPNNLGAWRITTKSKSKEKHFTTESPTSTISVPPTTQSSETNWKHTTDSKTHSDTVKSKSGIQNNVWSTTSKITTSRPTLKPWPMKIFNSTNKNDRNDSNKNKEEPVKRKWTRWTLPTPTPKTTTTFKTQNTYTSPTLRTNGYSTTERSNWWKRNNKWKRDKNKSTTISISTTTATTPRSTTTRAPSISNFNRIAISPKKKQLSVFGHGFKCEDLAKTIAGSMSCREFLKSYGLRYCNHRYIQKNCCKSRSEVCS